MTPTANRLKQRCYRYGPAVMLSLLIPAMSLLPARFFSRLGNAPSIPHVDKWIHALIYAVLSLALYHALSPEARKRPGPPLAVAAAASLYGALMELAQGFFTHSRGQDPMDALANTMGAFGVIFVIMLSARIRRSNHE